MSEVKADVVTLSAAQCRAARALLGWSQADLAQKAGMARKTIVDFEIAARRLAARTVRDIAHTFSNAGIGFSLSGNDGVWRIKAE